MRFEGRRILLTGGSGVIGGLVAAKIADEGGDVTVLGRAAPAGPYAFLQGDLASAAGIEAAAAAAAADPYDILINLAGIQHFGPLETQAPDHVAATYTVNLIAPVRLAQAVAPGMKARGWGQIVNVGSIFGSINFAHFATYSSSKAGLRAFSQALRRELAETGVGVTYIAPRAVRTPMNGPAVERFAALTNMAFDEPDLVARRIVQAVRADRKEVYLGFPESLFVRLNAILPGVVDGALRSNDLKARSLFSSRKEAP